MKQFENLFTELDKNLKRLRISTYGLSDTTLEEVSICYCYQLDHQLSIFQIFLKVASNENDGEIVRSNVATTGELPHRLRASSSRNFRNKYLEKKNGEHDSSDESGNFKTFIQHSWILGFELKLSLAVTKSYMIGILCFQALRTQNLTSREKNMHVSSLNHSIILQDICINCFTLY